MSSTPTPQVAYQPYKSKRHARTTSHPQSISSAPASPPPQAQSHTRPLSASTFSAPAVHTQRQGHDRSASNDVPIQNGVSSRPRPVSMNGSFAMQGDQDGANGHTNGYATYAKSGASTEPPTPVANEHMARDQGAPSPKPNGNGYASGLSDVQASLSPVGSPFPEHSSLAQLSIQSQSTQTNSTAPNGSEPHTPTTPSSSSAASPISPNPLEPIPGPSNPSGPAKPTPPIRKSSTFRHVPLRRSPLPSSPLRPTDPNGHSRASSSSSIAGPQQISSPQPRTLHTIPSVEGLGGGGRGHRPSPSPNAESIRYGHPPPPSHSSSPAPQYQYQSPSQPPTPRANSLPQPAPPPKPMTLHAPSPSLHVPSSPSPSSSFLSLLSPTPSTKSLPPPPPAQLQHSSSSSSTVSAPPTSTTHPTHSLSRPSSTNRGRGTPSAPYRPGFQPRGVYRPRTDEFVEERERRRGVGRVGRTRLERRLEKLVVLHFGERGGGVGVGGGGVKEKEKEKGKEREKEGKEKAKEGAGRRPGIGIGGGEGPGRRGSSFFSLEGAGELWKEVLGQGGAGGKVDVREEEQRITPWQPDSEVKECPLCGSSFHPLTNRKHHCRLCGQIICSLPVSKPKRPQPCSVLFVVDGKGRIEEVGEGVDYGVRRASVNVNVGGGGKEKGKEGMGEERGKGVRVCRECRPVLIRQQHTYEVHRVPTFVRLYEVFIELEKEIEDALPQFQELILNLSHDNQPTKEASAIRKRLLEDFAQYDALSKRIRKLPCKPGSSQDRVQLAVLTRANLFLQKHMVPLQSLSARTSTPSTPTSNTPEPPTIDPDSELAARLQPLLEQEALLETFVEEANASRKFEDAKTLKTNLREIRAEIGRVVRESEGEGRKGKGR